MRLTTADLLLAFATLAFMVIVIGVTIFVTL